MTTKLVRPAIPEDAATIVRLVQSLAVYEKEPVETVQLTEADVLRDSFGDSPLFDTLLAELDEARVDDIFDEGLHEFLTRMIGEIAALSSAVAAAHAALTFSWVTR